MGLVIMQDEKFVFANHWAAKIFGYSREEFLSFQLQDILELLHPEDREKIIEVSKKRLNGEDQPNGTRFRVRQKDGNIIEVLTFVKSHNLPQQACTASILYQPEYPMKQYLCPYPGFTIHLIFLLQTL